MSNRPPKSNRKSGRVTGREQERPRNLDVAAAPPHPLFDRSKRRLRELVDVCMGSHDGMPLLNVLLSRVPAIGEEVSVDAKLFRVIGVQHEALDFDGRAPFGTHAHLTVVEVPDAGWLHRPASVVSRRTRRRKTGVVGTRSQPDK